jgi:hypothetical protein
LSGRRTQTPAKATLGLAGIARATVVCLALLTSAALADAGPSSIGIAPTAQLGESQSGTTVGGACGGNGLVSSFWLLPLRLGDSVTISADLGPNTRLDVFPVGTTDADVDQTPALARAGAGSTGQAKTTFLNRREGDEPMRIATSCDPAAAGPYTFEVDVQHQIRVAIPRLSSVRRTGTLRVRVRFLDDDPVSDSSLSVRAEVRPHGSRSWLVVAQAAPKHGVAKITLNIPARLKQRQVRLRAVAAGPDYRFAASKPPRTVFVR